MITGDELVKRVRVLVNEADDDSSVSLLVVDRCSFDKNIMELLPQAVGFVQRNNSLPGKRVNVKRIAHALPVVQEDGKGYVELPGDYVSLVSVKLDGWKRPCIHSFTGDSAMAVLLDGGYSGAGVCRPASVEGVNDGGKRVLWLYPLPDGAAEVDTLLYEAVYDAAVGLEGCDACMADAVAYECAALLYTAFERYDAANMFHSLAIAACSGKANEKK